MELEFLESLVIIFSVSALVVLIMNRFSVPSLVGFLVAGAIVGPSGVGLVRDTHLIEILAEIGVVLLLFTVGIEFSLKKLRLMRRPLSSGGIQVLLTVSAAAAFSYLFTGSIGESVFIGFLAALSSTAIILKVLTDTGEIDTPHGRMMLGVLIFQDLCVVPMMLLVSMLSEGSINMEEITLRMFRAVVIITVVLVSSRWLIPYLLKQIVRTRIRELFIISIVLLISGITFFTSEFGLSIALGAFLAGLAISESEYSHQAVSDMLPFRETFMALFLVSIGMLFDIQYIIDHPLRILLIVLSVLGIKTVTGCLAGILNGYAMRVALHAGFGLAQIGEFSFILALAGRHAGLVGEEFYQMFLSSSVITMILTPFLLKSAPGLAAWTASRRAMRRLERTWPPGRERTAGTGKHDHVIIIGFGLNGRNLVRVLKSIDIPYVVLELNADTVEAMKERGEPIHYGDGASAEMLDRLGIKRARMLVIVISDPSSTRRILSIARRENPHIYVVVRTRYVMEVEDLKRLGADEVIPEEFETSIEIFSSVLQRYGVPVDRIEEYIASVRADSYRLLRRPDPPA